MDIKANVNYALEGKFKVDIFNKKGELIETTDWFNNFITPSGLSYIYNYNFADCFRYLSLGIGTTSNYGNNPPSANETTGLSSPITSIPTNLNAISISGSPGVIFGTSNLSGQYIGSWAYQEGGCGIVEDNDGPRFYRSWNIPFYNGYLLNDLTINEFMVSPSTGGSNGALAFSRVKKNIIIPQGTFSTISYQLKIKLGSVNIQTFSGGTFQTGNADITNEVNEVAQWNTLSGCYRQTYHGLAWIDSIGTTFVPRYGNLMEPSFTGLAASRFYLSPDNSQFNVNVSGGANSSESSSYLADGLLKFIVQNPPYQQIYDNSTSVPNTQNLPNNIRIKLSTAATSEFPAMYNSQYSSVSTNPDYSSLAVYDFQGYSTATPGSSGYDSSKAQFGNKILVSTQGFNMPHTGAVTGRSRVLTRRHSFLPAQSLGKNTRFGSLVYAYKNPISNDYYPMVDSMFFDTSGQYMMAHYRQITGIYFTNRGSGIVACSTYTVPQIDMPFNHKTFQGPGTGSLTNHPALNGIGGI